MCLFVPFLVGREEEGGGSAWLVDTFTQWSALLKYHWFVFKKVFPIIQMMIVPPLKTRGSSRLKERITSTPPPPSVGS